MTMTNKDFDLFIEAGFHAWSDGCLAADAHKEDGGACNFDSVKLYIRYGSAKCARLLARLGFRVCLEKRGVLRVFSPFGGQAERRTAAVEAIAKAFNSFNIPNVHAYVDYVMD